MAKRVPRRASKRVNPKEKAPTPVERGLRYERGMTKEPLAVRDGSAAVYGRSTLGSQALPPSSRRSVPATQAKNRFGEILQTARDSGPVFIERHGQAQAVVLGIDTYNKLTSNERTPQERELDYWTREFDALHTKMQTLEARQAVDALFSATEAELNRKGG